MSITAPTAIPAIRRAATKLRAICRCALLTCLCAGAAGAQAPATEIRTVFRVKYVAEDVVYLDGGRGAGLTDGLKLTIKRTEVTQAPSGSGEIKAQRIIAQLKVVSLAESSAVCEILSRNGEIRAGDQAFLAEADAQMVVQMRTLSGSRRYLQVITFSEGDPLDLEARDAVPKPPLPEINRARGRVGFEYTGLASRGTGAQRNTQVSAVVRVDMTRLGGTYWNFSGYWRGRMTSRSSASQPVTLTDLINRTYHLSLTYDSPTSPWVAGFGRLYLPWATSLNTIDGGYFGHKVGRAATVGLFAGSTPDPTSWNYNPDRRIGGVFTSVEGGNFASTRYVGTFGVAVSALKWRIERPFVFAENSLFFRRYVSIYNSIEADRPRATSPSVQPTPGVSRSYLTLRVQPHTRFSFDVSHTYFRDFPTFDPRLVGTGLLDKYLFQGLSGGMRLELPKRVTLYGSLGRSDRTGDTRPSWNQMYGLALGEIWRTGFSVDMRYAKYDSAFGSGRYRSVSLSRYFGEYVRWDVHAGWQDFFSPLTQQSRSRFLTSTFDWSIGPHYFLESGFTFERGSLQSYDQWFLMMGYRF